MSRLIVPLINLPLHPSIQTLINAQTRSHTYNKLTSSIHRPTNTLEHTYTKHFHTCIFTPTHTYTIINRRTNSHIKEKFLIYNDTKLFSESNTSSRNYYHVLFRGYSIILQKIIVEKYNLKKIN